jgi:hypothetical protein
VIETATVGVAGLGLWLPGFASLAAWSQGAPDASAVKPAGSALDRVNRRRASLLGRALADAGAQAACDAQIDLASVQTVIGSSIAEGSTLIGLLEQIWRSREPVSPAAFTMSVHNAASGLISISCGNRGFTTSLAADEDTSAAALLEAIGLVLAGGGPVVVACGDESAPAELIPEQHRWSLLAAAVVLAPLEHQGPCRARLRIVRPGVPTLSPAACAADVGRNPQAGLLDLIDAVSRAATGSVRLDRGRGLGYCAEIEPASTPASVRFHER